MVQLRGHGLAETVGDPAADLRPRLSPVHAGKLFPIKQLQTFLGSYAELKHDTLLYVKQNFAEKGGGGDENRPPVPRGFVEPNMAFWQELAGW